MGACLKKWVIFLGGGFEPLGPGSLRRMNERMGGSPMFGLQGSKSPLVHAEVHSRDCFPKIVPGRPRQGVG
jgi:hypothetical protein